jgi:hypothetical protein
MRRFILVNTDNNPLTPERAKKIFTQKELIHLIISQIFEKQVANLFKTDSSTFNSK